ncbi:hypothetical protein ASD64_01335 [Mesorhizobium sp. Root157]|uniref:hypothetical protein n=1 Tax=Mesorhizobium sp. Root157 TaxID=1736477 RepID=UPI0006F9C27B|nr:hypothetical protein [Mesorhizobium sp. Root157]KRA00246.1 hypothetical protein ASD64_01335 [Mesorhizobium sp. Root157]
MANAIYPKWKEAVMQATSNSSLGGTVKVALVDTGTYTYSAAHEFYSSVSGVVGTPATLGSKTFTGGVFDAADVTYTGVSGSSAEALIFYIDTGSSATSRLVAYLDTGWTNLPVTPNGGDITLQFNASGIFAL